MRLSPLVLLPVVIVAAAVTLAPLFSAQFVNYDDNVFVTGNPIVRRGLSAEGLEYAFVTLKGFWQPVTWLSHQLDCEIWGMRPAGHHATSIGLHLATVAACFFAFRGLTGSPWASLAIAAMYALHPLHVESVAWIAERKGLLADLFWMLCLAAYARFADRPGVANYLLVMAAFVGGMAAKSSLLTVPFALVILDFWPLARFAPVGGEGWRRCWSQLALEKLPLVALTAGFVFLSFHAQKVHGALELMTPPPLATRLALAPINYVEYLRHFFWPFGLACYYPHPGAEVPAGAALKATAILLVITGICLWQVGKRPYLIAGWLWFLLTLVPMIGIIQLGTHRSADRYTDIPLLGIYWSAVFGAREAWRARPALRGPLVGAGIVVLGLWGVLSFRQARVWHDSTTLFANALRQGHESPLAHINLGIALSESNQPNEAVIHFRRALELDPRQPIALNNIGLVLFNAGRVPEAAAWFERALAARGDYPLAVANLAICRSLQNQPEEAEKLFRAALAEYPDSVQIRKSFGVFLSTHGRLGEALEQFREGVRLEPDDVDARYNLAVALNQSGDAPSARREIEEILRQRPGWPPAKQLLDRLGISTPAAPSRE